MSRLASVGSGGDVDQLRLGQWRTLPVARRADDDLLPTGHARHDGSQHTVQASGLDTRDATRFDDDPAITIGQRTGQSCERRRQRDWSLHSFDDCARLSIHAQRQPGGGSRQQFFVVCLPSDIAVVVIENREGAHDRTGRDVPNEQRLVPRDCRHPLTILCPADGVDVVFVFVTGELT